VIVVAHEVAKHVGRFDAVVVGAGMAGLSAGAFLADAGRRVLIVDSMDRPGGLLAELAAPGFHMSVGVHNLTEAFEHGPVGEGVLAAAARHLELDGVEWLPLDTTYEVRYPGTSYRVPVGREAWIEAFARHHPGQQRALTGLVDLCERIARQLARLPITPDPSALARMPRVAPLVLRYMTANTLAVLRAHLGDRRLVRAVSSLCEPYLDLPPSRASFLVWATMTTNYITGTHHCRGGLQTLADAFANAVERRGGTLALGTDVTGITTSAGRATGVSGPDWEASAPVVVVAMDPRRLPRLLGPDVLPRRYRRRLENTASSAPFLAAYLATDLDIDPDTTVYEAFHARTESLTPAPDDILGVHVPTLVDPSQAPAGRHLVELVRPVGEEAEDPFTQATGMITRAGHALPGLADHLVPLTPDSPTPYVLRRFSAPYGWACTPLGAGIGRLGHTTPVKGLYLAGQWTVPGHGIPRVVASGAEVARIITDDRPHRPLLPLT
jgi:phytoene dehydrogenase-like protein